MSLVKTNKQAQNLHKVGNTIGERRNLAQGAAPAARPAVAKAVDKFSNEAATARRGDVANFAGNVSFKKGMAMFAPEAPYKRALHGMVENGSAPRVANVNAKPPSDAAILRFLDRVIESTADRKSAKQAAPQNVSINKAAAKPAQVPAKPAVSGRPIPSIAGQKTNRA